MSFLKQHLFFACSFFLKKQQFLNVLVKFELTTTNFHKITVYTVVKVLQKST